MKRILSITALICLLPLYAAIAPYSEDIGIIKVEIEENSNAEKILKAFSEEYTEEWIESYAGSDELFSLAYTPILSTLLPMSNLIVAEEENGLALYSLDSKDIVHVLLEEGNIKAISVKRAWSPSVEEESRNTFLQP